MAVKDKILALTKQLYPTGRAWRMFPGSVLEKLHSGLAVSEAKAYEDAVSLLDSALPDNANFTVDDATDWERRLGLITNDLVSLDDRKLAIIRKMNHPGTIPARQHYLYIQGQLQAAGFNVYVYENIFPGYPSGFITKTPEEVSGGPGLVIQHGDIQHGDAQHGEGLFEKVVNSIDSDLDLTFNIGPDLRDTFFIGGSPLGTYANVDINRKDEFRQLILKLKPAHLVAFLFVNYV